MNKFKVGDKVKIVRSTFHPIDATLALIGATSTVELLDSSDNTYEVGGYYFNESDLELITEPKTLDNLEVGDIIINGDHKIKVTGVMNYYIFRDAGSPYGYSTRELQEYGYKIVNKPTTTIDGKTYILNDELKKAIELAKEV